MQAIVITKPGGPQLLQLRDCTTPFPGIEEVLIQVKASGLNLSDVFQRKGNYPAPTWVSADIMGMKVSGIVTYCGPKVTMRKLSQPIYSFRRYHLHGLMHFPFGNLHLASFSVLAKYGSIKSFIW